MNENACPGCGEPAVTSREGPGPGNQDDCDPGYGAVVIRLNGCEVSRTPLNSHVYPGDWKTLQQYAADWLASLRKEKP